MHTGGETPVDGTKAAKGAGNDLSLGECGVYLAQSLLGKYGQIQQTSLSAA